MTHHGLSTRAWNCLRRSGVGGELPVDEVAALVPRMRESIRKRWDEEGKIRNLGKGTLMEIEAWLRARGVVVLDGPSDERIREWWRSVQGPHAELTGPLIRFAARVWREAQSEKAGR